MSDPNETEPRSKALRILNLPPLRILIALSIMGVITFVLFSAIPVLSTSLLSAEATLAFGALVALFVVGRFIEQRSAEQFGMGAQRGMKSLAVGFLLGAGLMSTVIGVMAVAGWYRVTGIGGTGDSALISSGSGLPVLILESAVLFLAVGVFEEILARGIIFRILEEGTGSIIAIVVSSAIFGWGHLNNQNSSPLAVIAITVEAGILLSASYMLVRNLWMPIGLHWAWNLFEGPVFGTSVSGSEFPVLLRAEVSGPALWTGGAFGPEAGLVALILGTALGLVMLVMAARRGQMRPFGRKSAIDVGTLAPQQ